MHDPTPDETKLIAQWAERSANIVSMSPAEAVREIMRTLGGFALQRTASAPG